MDQPKCLNNILLKKHMIHHHGDDDDDHDDFVHHHLPTTTTTKIMKRFINQQSRSSSLEDYHEGGSILWPPRSYSCSFCKREFKSAQALGGHMNVHRRDRALLKQAINIHDDDDHHHQNHHDHVMNPSSKPTMMLPQKPFQVCSPKTNSVTTHHCSLSRVSSNNNNYAISGISKVINTSNYDCIGQPKVSMELDLAIGSSQNKEEDHQQELSFRSYKRFKKSNDNEDYNVALLPFFEEIKCSNNIKDNRGLKLPEILNVRASKSMEDLDLELRLGEPLQKIK